MCSFHPKGGRGRGEGDNLYTRNPMDLPLASIQSQDFVSLPHSKGDGSVAVLSSSPFNELEQSEICIIETVLYASSPLLQTGTN